MSAVINVISSPSVTQLFQVLFWRNVIDRLINLVSTERAFNALGCIDAVNNICFYARSSQVNALWERCMYSVFLLQDFKQRIGRLLAMFCHTVDWRCRQQVDCMRINTVGHCFIIFDDYGRFASSAHSLGISETLFRFLLVYKHFPVVESPYDLLVQLDG